MRKKPLKICARPGCNKKTTKRFCEEHKKWQWKEQDKKRPNSSQRGYDSKWSKFRKLYLERNPICVFCKEKGVITAATEVDHIETLRERPDLKFEESNLRPLCKRCHSKHTWHNQGLGKCRENESRLF